MTWLLVSLVVAPSVFGPMVALADSRPGQSASRDGRDPGTEDSDPREESESEPLEDGLGTEFLRASSVSLLRHSARGLPTRDVPHADRRDRGRLSGPRGPERSSLAGSGRLLRLRLQSHVC